MGVVLCKDNFSKRTSWDPCSLADLHPESMKTPRMESVQTSRCLPELYPRVKPITKRHKSETNPRVKPITKRHRSVTSIKQMIREQANVPQNDFLLVEPTDYFTFADCREETEANKIIENLRNENKKHLSDTLYHTESLIKYGEMMTSGLASQRGVIHSANNNLRMDQDLHDINSLNSGVTRFMSDNVNLKTYAEKHLKIKSEPKPSRPRSSSLPVILLSPRKDDFHNGIEQLCSRMEEVERQQLDINKELILQEKDLNELDKNLEQAGQEIRKQTYLTWIRRW